MQTMQRQEMHDFLSETMFHFLLWDVLLKLIHLTWCNRVQHELFLWNIITVFISATASMFPLALQEETEASPAEVALCLSTRKEYSMYTNSKMFTHDPCAVVPAAELPSSTVLGSETEHIRSSHNNTYVRTKIKVRPLGKVVYFHHVDLRSSYCSHDISKVIFSCIHFWTFVCVWGGVKLISLF